MNTSEAIMVCKMLRNQMTDNEQWKKDAIGKLIKVAGKNLPVEPIHEEETRGYICPDCGTELDYDRDAYCPGCGRCIAW